MQGGWRHSDNRVHPAHGSKEADLVLWSVTHTASNGVNHSTITAADKKSFQQLQNKNFFFFCISGSETVKCYLLNTVKKIWVW